MKKLAFLVFSLLLLSASPAFGESVRYSSRVLLVPLDDRPPCLQFPMRMGLIGDVEVVTPPRELLGRFTEFGKSDAIVEWLRKQDLKRFDAAIISLDMVAYGGLVASRVFETPAKDAMRRAEIAFEMRRRAPRLKIYGSSVIMRLAPTSDGKNEEYREKLARWAEVSADANEKVETERLEKEIPASALEGYKQARSRNLELNRYAIEMARRRVFDYLILSQDDAKPRGVHIADRESLIKLVDSQSLAEQVAIQPGADEVSMLLLSRAITDKYKYHPKIKAIYSSEKLADQVMPFEDRPLRKTVSFHIRAAGGLEVANEEQADILFYVYPSRHEPGIAASFSKQIRDRLSAGSVGGSGRSTKEVIVADVDPKGDVQGADAAFTEALHRGAAFRFLAGYASWNTAGNTIGTALPHGILFAAAKNVFASRGSPGKSSEFEFIRRSNILSRVGEAQSWFMLNRLLDDYVYHTVVRPDAIKFSRTKGWSTRYDDAQATAVEEYARPRVFTRAQEFLDGFALAQVGGSTCTSIDERSFELPWNRTFEAEIDFKLGCKRPDIRKGGSLKKTL